MITIVRESGWAHLVWLIVCLFLCIPYGLAFYYMMNQFLQVKKRWWTRVAVFIAGSVAYGNVVYIGDAFNILFLLPFFIAAVCLCTEGSRYAKSAVILIVYPMIMAVNALFDNYFRKWIWQSSDQALGALDFLLRCLFWALVAWLAGRFVPDPEDGQPPMLSPPMWLLLDLLALTPAAAVFTLVVFPAGKEEGLWTYFDEMALYILPFAVLSSLGLLYAAALLSRHEALRRKESMWDLQRLYYQNLEQEQTQVRRLRHDMANHLQALSGMLDEPEKAREYLRSLTNLPGLTVGRKFCENPTVNTVLAGKAAMMEAKSIRGDFAVSLPEALPLSDTDLCALFANALDNAIEACERVPSTGERVIWVRARADRGLMLVQIANRTGGGHPATLETTKSDKARHGFGLAIIREIAGRADGTCSIEQRPGIFELVVTVPMEAKKEPPHGRGRR